LLWIVLRRIGDVLLTLIPLILAGVVTLQICVLIGMPLNFANIIALPLLLGVGVAFKIYYIMAWRDGQTNLLQTSLTRAVFYSALTTATAFGSLWFSSHPGTSSMGKLLALSLICTLAAAVLFQPVLMGKPREVARSDENGDSGGGSDGILATAYPLPVLAPAASRPTLSPAVAAEAGVTRPRPEPVKAAPAAVETIGPSAGIESGRAASETSAQGSSASDAPVLKRKSPAKQRKAP
jgi:uncharacterized membrane protein